jgi:hypothetical protein
MWTHMSEVSVQFGGWDQVRAHVDQLIANCPDPFDSRTVANAHDLLAACAEGAPVPTGVGKGYWETVCFSWGNFEIEVFEDHLEVYRFYDQRSEIWNEEHRPGEAFTRRLLAELAAITP